MRELQRVYREFEQAKKRKEEAEGVKQLSIEERALLAEERLKEYEENKNKTKYNFLQKYYHKGAFFMDSSDPIYQRDYNQPTLEDKSDRSALPEAMQVRNFGKSGRSKWTHLTAEDTTKYDSGWGSRDAVSRQDRNAGRIDKPEKRHKEKK